MNNKKAEMGIGTLIIFIALLLVAAIAAGVLIQTAGSLQEKALSTGDQAKGQIATNVRVVEVSATNGNTGFLRNFTQIIKLAPGSDPIKLDQTLFTFNTFDKTATLQYAGLSASLLNGVSGYYTISSRNYSGGPSTWETVTADYDEDGSIDVLYGGDDSAYVSINLSNSGTPTTLNLGNCTAGVWASGLSANSYISSATGYCDTVDNNDVAAVYLVPSTNIGNGNYAVEYLQQGSNWVEGNLQRGDVIKLYFEAPKFVGEDENVRLNFIPKVGTPTLTEFITPNVISTERTYLYP